ncbi:MAG: hypothetical protein AB7P21_30690 [Lautropia sp.]
MGEELLAGSEMADAVRLLERLDAIGASPSVAAWIYFDDEARWQLVVAGPELDRYLPKNPIAAYRVIVDALGEAFASLLSSGVRPMRTDAAPIRAIRSLRATSPDDDSFVRLGKQPRKTRRPPKH